jgi:Ftsk gamma domain
MTVRSANDLLADATRLVVAAQVGSSLRLQQQLHVEPDVAERLLDAMHDAGIVGPYAGADPREVLLSHTEVDAALAALARRTDRPQLIGGWLDPRTLAPAVVQRPVELIGGWLDPREIGGAAS